MRPFAKTLQPRGRAIRASEMRGAEWAYSPIRFGFCVKQIKFFGIHRGYHHVDGPSFMDSL